uniref:Uncharacterized protein n=1 Tax=viral metagenome TaxID=1070528 RepID=A0A6C0EQ87_9ZZZZ
MKLTKGKIRKLYNKKKQTLKKKKINKKKSPNRNNTFRSKRGFNLSRKSLKRLNRKYKGGEVESTKDVDEKTTIPKNNKNIDHITNTSIIEDDKSNPNEEDSLDKSHIKKTGFENEEIQESPSGFTGVISNPPKEYQNIDKETTPEQDDLTNIPEKGSENINEASVTTSQEKAEPEVSSEEGVLASEPEVSPEESVSAPEEPVSAPEESISAPEESVSAPEEPVSAPEESVSAPEEPVSAPEESVSAPEESVAAPEESVAAPEVEQPEVQDNSESTSKTEQTPVVANEDQTNNVEEGQSNSDNKLTESINNVVDIISDRIAVQVSKSIGDKSGEGMQNGFESVGNAAESMASKGGKIKKTRKFRLTKHKKNKTKGQK